MAHSIQTYRGKSEVINDLDLLVIIGFSIAIINHSTEFRGLQGLAGQWQESLRQYGPGTIDLKLEQIVVDPERLLSLERLLGKILEQISHYHEKIPADVLNERLSVSGVRFNDFDVANIEEAVKKLQTVFFAA